MTEQTTSEQSSSDRRFANLQSIVDGASIYVVGEACYKVVGFAINFLLARYLGDALYGIYAYAYSFVTISTRFAGLGADSAVLKFLPMYSDDQERQNRTFGLATLTTVIGTCTAAGLLWFLAPTINQYTLNKSLLVDVLRVFALLLPFDTLTIVISRTFRGIERPFDQVLLLKIIRPGIRVCGVVVALLISLTLLETVAVLVVAGVVAFLVGVVFVFRRSSLRPSFPRMSGDTARKEVISFYDYSVPLLFAQAGSILYNRIDIFMVGYLMSASVTGYYNIAFLVSSIILLPLTGCNQLFAPIASRLYENDEKTELNGLYATVTRWVFSAALLAALGAIIYAREIMSIFGPEYVAGTPVLMLFAVGQLLNSTVGPSNYLLMMTDHQYLSFVNHWIFGVVNVVLNYFFILWFGLIGAALATASIVGVLNIVRWIEIQYLEQLSPYSRAFYKPILAGIGALAVMVVVKVSLSGLVSLVIGGCAGVLLYAVLLYALGIEDDDIDFAKQMLGRAQSES